MKGTRRRLLQTSSAGTVAWAGWWLHRPCAAATLAGPTLQAAAWFPFGTHIYREPHLPMAQLLADLPQLKKLGFSMIKIQESWAYDERVEGQVDLSNVERLIDAAKQEGLRVFFGVTMEQAPAWLWRKHPDAAMVFEDGLRNVDPTPYVVPGDGKPGPCWHHPGVRQAAGRFLRTVVQRLGRYDNIAVWNVWQEVGFYSWAQRAGHGKLCYCAYTLAAYRRWLVARYKKIQRLNDAWGTPYASFAEVEPPRVFHMVPATVDWRSFMDAQYFEDALAFKAQIFRRADSLARPVMTHVSRPTVGSSQDFSYARAVDVFGSSVYPDWGQGDWDSPLMALEQTRGAAAGKPFWAAEVQGGPIGEGLAIRRVPTARDVRRWVLSSIAMGARGVCFWNHRPEPLWNEAHGFGLLDGDGTAGPRAQTAGALGLLLSRHADFFANARTVPASLGIVVSQDLHHIAEATGGEFQRGLQAAHRGSYRLAWDAAVPVDFIDEVALSAGDASPRATPAVLWWPFGVAMAPETIAALQQHVERGGHAILEAGAGHLNQFGMAAASFMSPALQDWLGIDAQTLQPIAAPDGGSAPATPADRMPFRLLAGAGPCNGSQLSPAHVLQHLVVRMQPPHGASGVTTILKDGDNICGVLVSKGSKGGQVAVVGTHPGIARQLQGESSTSSFVVALFRALGVEADSIGGLPRRRLVAGAREAWFVFNGTRRPRRISLSAALSGRHAEDLEGALSDHANLEIVDVSCVLVQGA